jgi:hypothetical protein
VSNILSYASSSEQALLAQVMLHEQLFRKISYTWRNSDFFNNIGATSPFTMASAKVGFPPRPCEKVIVANHNAISCH